MNSINMKFETPKLPADKSKEEEQGDLMEAFLEREGNKEPSSERPESESEGVKFASEKQDEAPEKVELTPGQDKDSQPAGKGQSKEVAPGEKLEKRKSLEEVANERAQAVMENANAALTKMKYLLVPEKLLTTGAQKVGRAGAELAGKTVGKIDQGIDQVTDKMAEKCLSLWDRCRQAKNTLVDRIKKAADKVDTISLKLSMKTCDAMLSIGEEVEERELAKRRMKQLKAEEKVRRQQWNAENAILFKARAVGKLAERQEKLKAIKEKVEKERLIVDRIRQKRSEMRERLSLVEAGKKEELGENVRREFGVYYEG
jgi:hypothetical protein